MLLYLCCISMELFSIHFTAYFLTASRLLPKLHLFCHLISAEPEQCLYMFLWKSPAGSHPLSPVILPFMDECAGQQWGLQDETSMCKISVHFAGGFRVCICPRHRLQSQSPNNNDKSQRTSRKIQSWSTRLRANGKSGEVFKMSATTKEAADLF